MTATIGTLYGLARGVKHVDDRHRHITRLSFIRVCLHAEAGLTVDFIDCSAKLIDGPRNVGGNEINASHVQSDHLGSQAPDFGIFRVDVVSTIGVGPASTFAKLST